MIISHHSQLPELDERMDESRATEVVVVIVAAEHQRHDELSRVKLDYALDPLSIKTATTTTLMSLLDFATKLARFLAYLLPLATVGVIEG